MQPLLNCGQFQIRQLDIFVAVDCHFPLLFLVRMQVALLYLAASETELYLAFRDKCILILVVFHLKDAFCSVQAVVSAATVVHKYRNRNNNRLVSHYVGENEHTLRP